MDSGFFRLVPTNPFYNLRLDRNDQKEEVRQTVMVAPGCAVHYSDRYVCGVTIHVQHVLCPKCEALEVHDHTFFAATRDQQMYVRLTTRAYPRATLYRGDHIVVQCVQGKIVGLVVDLSDF